MYTMIKSLSFNKRVLQECPLCGSEQPIVLKGFVKDIQDETKTVLAQDKGYSFCNCHNIYYTAWKNIDQEVYDIDYVNKYAGTESLMANYGVVYFDKIQELQNGKTGSLLEIGSINDGLLNYAKDFGHKPCGLDIPKRDSDHKMFSGDFETIDFKNKYDIVFASHIFEHFLDPIGAVEKCNSILNDDGVLFVAMPDPYFIDYANVYLWGHWHVEEHHIMWDMESFIDVVESKGFTCELKHRSTGTKGFICWGDFHLIFKKKGN